MTITLNIPAEFEPQLRNAFGGNLDRAALEALVSEAYRTGKLGIGEVSKLLGLASRFDAEAWLGRRGVNWNYGAAELQADRETLSRVMGDVG